MAAPGLIYPQPGGAGSDPFAALEAARLQRLGDWEQRLANLEGENQYPEQEDTDNAEINIPGGSAIVHTEPNGTIMSAWNCALGPQVVVDVPYGRSFIVVRTAAELGGGVCGAVNQTNWMQYGLHDDLEDSNDAGINHVGMIAKGGGGNTCSLTWNAHASGYMVYQARPGRHTLTLCYRKEATFSTVNNFAVYARNRYLWARVF